MTILEQQKLCKQASIDVTNYFGSECPNMLTFFTMFKFFPAKELLTIRINVKDNSVPTLEYNPNWVEKAYGENKFFFTYAVYSEMLKFILHHTTKRSCGPTTGLASAVITNCRETRKVLNFLPQDKRNEIVLQLDQWPSKPWLESLIAPEALAEKDMILERIVSILNSLPSEKLSQADGMAEMVEMLNDDPFFGSDPDYEMLPSWTSSLEDYYSMESTDQSSNAWAENPLADETITKTVEALPESGWGVEVNSPMLSAIKLANKRRVDVSSILSRLNGRIKSRKTENTRMKPNRRFPDDWQFLGQRNKYKSKVLFANDFSGSMNEADNLKAFSVFDNFLKDSEFHYTVWDTTCLKPKPWTGKFQPGDSIEALSSGGTIPECIGQMLEQEGLHYDCVIVFTDTEFAWKERKIPPSTQLVVISTENENSLRRLPAFVDFSMTMTDLIGED